MSERDWDPERDGPKEDSHIETCKERKARWKKEREEAYKNEPPRESGNSP